MLKHNVPVKVVSERLGHSSPAFTLTVYQHVMPGMQADAARLFAAAIDESDELVKADLSDVVEMTSDPPVTLLGRDPLDAKRSIEEVEDDQNS